MPAPATATRGRSIGSAKAASRWRAWVVGVVVLCASALTACHTATVAPDRAPAAPTALCASAAHCASDPLVASQALADAGDAARAAARTHGPTAAIHWARCAVDAYPALASTYTAAPASTLATRCTQALLADVLASRPKGWTQGPVRVRGLDLVVDYRRLSPYLQGPLSLTLARDVPMTIYGGARHQRAGFGVPLAAIGARCKVGALCELLPPEGVFRNVTAWLEPAAEAGGPARLVIADAVVLDALLAGSQRVPLAYDTSAALARGVATSKLNRLAVWGLLGGDEVGRRAGLYLMEDYDPNKRPVVMIHGLGSSPLTWARMSDALWSDPQLRAHFQVWHVVYQTNSPLLINRLRVKGYLDKAWSVLDPEGDDPSRHGMVVVGHSLGGVIARMLCVDSGDTLWNAAFLVPPHELKAAPDDAAVVDRIFRFPHYPGINRAVFMAAPHRGSPSATRWFGRLARMLVGHRTPELQALRKVADADPQAVKPELRNLYRQARLNSISTLQVSQPVREAGQALLPVPGITYHTIAGALSGRTPPTDGVVPLDSATLPGAASTLVIAQGHNVQESPEGVAEVMRILHEALQDAP